MRAGSWRAVVRAAAISVAMLAGAAGCATPCAMLAERLCDCPQTVEANRRACALAGDRARRLQSEELARQAGVEPQNVCREALRKFRCPGT